MRSLVLVAALLMFDALALTAHAAEESTATPAATAWKLRGTVVAKDGGAAIPGAMILVKGVAAQYVAGADGAFEIDLPPGEHELTILMSGFVMQVRSVSAASPELTIEMPAIPVETADADGEPGSVAVEPGAAAAGAGITEAADAELTVTATRVEGGTKALLEEKRLAPTVSETIGSEQISKSGDSTAATALRRVTGLSVVDGKYVYVRGMGERYSSTLLNGTALPSPDPERRVVPLDLFPAGLIESMVIHKSFLPDQPGEFGGGTVALRTRVYPLERERSLSISSGLNSESAFQEGLAYRGGRYDWTGMDDGTRSLPGNVQDASDDSPLHESDMFSDRGYSPEELEELGESMPNRWNLHRASGRPDFGMSGTVGDSFLVNQRRFGYLASLSYDTEDRIVGRTQNYYTVGAGGALEPSNRYEFDEMQTTTTVGGVLNFGGEVSSGHAVRATTLVTRITDDEARRYQGFNRDVGGDIRVTRLRWLERMLFAQQVHGAHFLPQLGNTAVEWRYAYSRASRHEPDTREYRYDHDSSGVWMLSNRPEGNSRLFSDLLDQGHDLGTDITVPVGTLAEQPISLKTGFAAGFKDRVVDTRRFKFMHKGPDSNDSQTLALDPEQIFVPENIGSNGFQFEETTRQTDNYRASQRTLAAYAMAELYPVSAVRLSGGARLEAGRQSVKTFELFNPDAAPVRAELDRTDVLPGAAATWQFHESMQLRGAFGRTLARPDFRELSPATFNDVTGGREIFGNPDLERTVIDNFDMRLEWYPTEGETFSIGGFYKRFTDPIETVVVVSAQHSITYANARGAENLGIEIEGRKELDALAPSLTGAWVAFNGALIRSRVQLDPDSGIQTSDERPLQGQSPYVANVQVGWDRPKDGLSVSVAYNVFGKRIAEVGAQGAPDVYEQPYHQVDLVVSRTVAKGMKVKVKGGNLLDSQSTLEQGGHVTQRYHKGREASLGFTYDF